MLTTTQIYLLLNPGRLSYLHQLAGYEPHPIRWFDDVPVRCDS